MQLRDTYNAHAAQESLEAMLRALKAGSDAGLEQLHQKTDLDSVRRKLIILLEANRHKEAAEVVRGQAPHEAWCALAICAFASNGEIEQAEYAFEASLKFQNVVQRSKCRLIFADALYTWALRNRPDRSPLTASAIKEFEKKQLARVREILTPLIVSIEGNQVVTTEFEQVAVELALKTSYFLGDKERCKKFTKLLATREPASLLLAQAVLGRWVDEIPPNLDARLLRDHPNSFEAKLMAASLRGGVFGMPIEGFELAKQLISTAKTDDQRTRLCVVLEALADELGGEAVSFVEEQAPKLLIGNDFQLGLRIAALALKSGKLEETRTTLEQIRNENDFNWLQLWGGLQLQSGKGDDALSALQKAASLCPHPEFYARAAQVAFNLNKLAEAADLLRQQLSCEPGDIAARSRLAFIYINMGEHRRAASEFATLYSLQPAQPAHALNQALGLGLAGDSDASLRVYEVLCAVKDPPAEAFIGCAQILRARDNAAAGFQILKAVQEKYWGDPRFVAAFMDLAHAGQDDACAHEALLRLQELQTAGVIHGALKPVSFDEIKGQFQEFQKKKEELLKLTLQGTLPWLMVEQLLGRVPYGGWFLRTQSVSWLSEDPLVRAEFSIYSTNSFYVRSDGNQRPILEEIGCPPKGTAVAVDLSALITLHRLGILEHAASYFGRLLIPASFVARILEESSRLVLHQKSQKTFLEEIKAELDGNRIKVLKENPDELGLPFINEHPMDGEAGHFYALRDVAQFLRDEGRISDSKYSELMSVSSRPSGIDENHPPLSPAQPVLVQLSTLKALHNFKALDEFVTAFETFICEKDRTEIVGDMRGFEALGEVYHWHIGMWESIRTDSRFVQVSAPVRSELKRREEEGDREIYLSAYFLAAQQKIPLMADDRACQSIALNECCDLKYPSFGTDKLLQALADSGSMSGEQVADALVQLVRWRYRFIIVPPAVLTSLARQHLGSPPGKPLRDVARYIHDCMRDPGLFSGFESTEPPITMGYRLFYKWATVVAEFLIDVWSDSSIAEAKAEAITSWAILEMLPSPPKAMGEIMAEKIASLLPRMVMAHGFICSAKIKEHQRANRALLMIKSELGITDAEYARFFVEVIDGTRD